jgi:hypothetical protein
MANLYPNFPVDCSDEDLKRALKEYSEEIYNKRANINTVLQLSPLI